MSDEDAVQAPPEPEDAAPPPEAEPVAETGETAAVEVAEADDEGQLLRRVAVSGLAVAGSLGLLEVLRARFQKSQVFAPVPYPVGIWDPWNHGLPAEDVFFESDGEKLHGWWMPYEDARATVVYCHGNAGNLGDRVHIFRALRRMRVAIFAFDYRGYGRSEGEPSEKGLCADARAAVDLVVEERGVDLSSVILFGHSLGGAVAIDAALNRPSVAGLVVQSSFTDLCDMARHFYPSVPMHLITRNGFRSIEKVGLLEMPKLFIHGTEDPTVPFELGQRLYEAAAEPKEWFPISGAGHNDVYVFGGLPYFRALARFRERCARSPHPQTPSP